MRAPTGPRDRRVRRRACSRARTAARHGTACSDEATRRGPQSLRIHSLTLAPDQSGFDPAPSIEQMSSPGLWLYGGADKSIPTDRSVGILAQMKQAGKDFTIVVFPRAGHGLVDNFPTAHEAPSTLVNWIEMTAKGELAPLLDGGGNDLPRIGPSSEQAVDCRAHATRLSTRASLPWRSRGRSSKSASGSGFRSSRGSIVSLRIPGGSRDFRGSRQGLRRRHARRLEHESRDPRRRVHGARRPVWMWQDDCSANGRRARRHQ